VQKTEMFSSPASLRAPWAALLLAALVLSGQQAHALPPLQLFVELTRPGKTLRPPPGRYSGPVVISKPITIDGQGQVTIDGGGSGTVLTIKADGVTLRGLHITNSGPTHDGLDAGIGVEADHALIEDNHIDDVLFGISLKNSHHCIIRRNLISSRPLAVSMRGEGIRLWYSEENRIEDNEIDGVRDLVFANSANNRITGNTIRNSRMAMEFVFSPDNQVEDNFISHNSTGVVVLYSNGLQIRRNRLQHMRSISGSALAIKESSRVVIEDNEILHCAVGLGGNTPIHPENIFQLRGNRFAYNDVALYFYGEKGGHIIHGNRFEQNFNDVVVSAPHSARGNDWKGNYWDRYQGFDRDGDGIGDLPYELYLFASRIWMDRPMSRFFRGSPLIGLIDWMQRLAPLSEPDLVLRDPEPKVD